MPDPQPFTPDRCLAPAATLREWMKEKGATYQWLAALCAGDGTSLEAGRLISDVLDGVPLTQQHAEALSLGTRIPVHFWLALERDYRDGLAAGLTDATPELRNEQRQPGEDAPGA